MITDFNVTDSGECLGALSLRGWGGHVGDAETKRTCKSRIHPDSVSTSIIFCSVHPIALYASPESVFFLQLIFISLPRYFG